MQEKAPALASALKFAPKERAAIGLEKIDGLGAWLQSVELDARQPDVEAWCEKSGVASLEETKKRTGDLAASLQLAPREREKLGHPPQPTPSQHN